MDGNIIRGEARSFTTTGKKEFIPATPIIRYISLPVVKEKEEKIKITVREEQEEKEEKKEKKDIEIIKLVSRFKDTGFGTFIEVSPGEIIYYSIEVKNNTEKVIKNIFLDTHIPEGLIAQDKNLISHQDSLIWRINILKPGETKTFFTNIKVSDAATIGNQISSETEIIFPDGKKYSNPVRIVIIEQGDAVDTNIEGQIASIFNAISNIFSNTLL
ncbi:MAG: DUF11 domain-containing protein [Candidatus Pacebacteria bacterium]|nr:DUF11 domain-containing protein [Candidatus Paceibacterota bacterium]